MQETETAEIVEQSTSLLDLPVARLQIVQARDIVEESWLDRKLTEPTLAQNADGLWVLTVRRQGEHGQFTVPYIGSEIVLADAELGMVAVLIGYHGTEAYGHRDDKHVTSGQFYRYYQQAETGKWKRVEWRSFNDELRTMLISTIEEHGPAWARKPGKLQTERGQASKVTMTSYKVVRVIDGRYYSLYNPEIEYVIGQQVKEAAKHKHRGGFYSYPTMEMGVSYLEGCVKCLPFHADVITPDLALLECEIGGKIISYGHKMASTYLRPVRVLEIRPMTYS